MLVMVVVVVGNIFDVDWTWTSTFAVVVTVLICTNNEADRTQF